MKALDRLNVHNLQSVSVILGYEGEITPEVQEVGNILLDLAKKTGLIIDFNEENLRIILQGGRNVKPEVLATALENKIAENLDNFVGSDKEDLKYIVHLIKHKLGLDALSAANRLDTAVRDIIPKNVWLYLRSFGDL